jgi:hypothetical protein
MESDDQDDPDLLDDDAFEFVMAGCPRGWLIPERTFNQLFRGDRGRFEDVRRKRVACAPTTVGQLLGC